jgi:predicted O-methyltransferase YrrM
LPDVSGWRVGNTDFIRYYEQGSTRDRFYIQKDQSLIDLYVDLCTEFRGARIVELGIAAGGSTALLALLTSPAKLVACDIAANPVQALSEFLDERGLTETVRPFYGIDQADQKQLAALVDREFGAEPIDLVIDDASHQWDRTRASFDVLYPRLRPGGTFVIEDWGWEYLVGDALIASVADPASEKYRHFEARYESEVRAGNPHPPPLARLGVELMLAATASPDVVADVTINQHWISVRRGPQPLDRDGFRLDDCFSDHFGWFTGDPMASENWWLRRLWERRARPTP